MLRHQAITGPSARLREPSNVAVRVDTMDAAEESVRPERRIALVRLLVLLALLPVLWWDGVSPDSEMVLTALMALVVGYIVGTLYFLPRLHINPRKDLFLTIDVLAAAAFVYFTGGVDSYLLPLMYLPILTAAVRFDLRLTFYSGIAVSVLVVLMWSVADGGLLSLGPAALKVTLFTLTSLFLALFFGKLAHDTRLSLARYRAHVELSQAYEATLEGWARALELRDNETEGHTQRVAELTVWLARAMGLGEEELLQVRRGAMLHDIGKIAIPDRIMLKPDALSDDEVEIMRRHPIYAYDLLSPITYLRPALDIPYCHHEKWDGTGYPRGLKGEEIPLAARIFAVVDVWDALCSNRPYRSAWTEDQALEYIRSQAGKHFDPRVLDTFIKMSKTA